MTHILPLGDVLAVDADGHLINPCRHNLIAPPWSAAVEALVAAYRHHLGARLHSVYLRGSVPKGGAIEGVADIDSFAVLLSEPEDTDAAWIAPLQARMAEEFPFHTGVEVNLVSRRTVCEDPKAWVWPFLIKTQSLCLWGDDLAPSLPGYRPGLSLAGHAPRLAADLEEFRAQCPEGAEAELAQDIREWCQWIMKRVVRSGFELTMARERTYTRDLYPCYTAFARHYPERAPQMRQALQWAIVPADTKLPLQQFLEEFGGWLVGEVAAVFRRPEGPYRIRLGTPLDAPQVSALVCGLTDAMLVNSQSQEAQAFYACMQPQLFALTMAKPDRFYLVAELDKRVVGMIMVKDQHYVGQFFVAADVQGQGIGSALWAAAFSRVQCERGATEFTVYASIAAEPVYRRFGFLPTGSVTVLGGFHCVPMSRAASVA